MTTIVPGVSRGALLTAVLASSLISFEVRAQSIDPAQVQARIDALQREIEAIARDAGKRAPPTPSTADAGVATTDAGGAEATVEARLDELSSQLRILARRIELDKEQAAERAKQAPQPAAGRSGFSVQSADGSFRLRLRGLVQSDGRFFLSDVDRRGTDGFLLRRVRPIAEATLYGLFDVRIMPDFGNGTTALPDAYIDARIHPAFKIRAGKFKPPIGFERLVSASELTFIERALPTLLVPNRDVGLMVHGDFAGGNLAYAAGVFNGVPDGGSADGDVHDGRDGVARLFVQPFRARRDSVWRGLGAGAAVSYGVRRGASATSTGLPVFRTSGQQTFFGFRGDDPVLGPVLADGAHTRVSVQGHYYYGAFGLLGEHVLSSQKVRRTSATTLDHSAWQLAGSWVLTGETPSYRGVTPRAPFDRAAGNWGAVELTARYSALSIDPQTFPFFANPATASRGARAWAAGVNWLLNTGVKLQINYERTAFVHAGGVERQAEHDLLTRVQFAF